MYAGEHKAGAAQTQMQNLLDTKRTRNGKITFPSPDNSVWSDERNETMTFKKGDHIQQYGGYAGIAFDGKTWVRYECSGCALASGLSLPGQRLSAGDHQKVWKKYFLNGDKTKIVRHNVELHKAWLAAGKPLPFNH